MAAIVAVEVIVSLTPVSAQGSVIARRVILWAALGTVIAVATHELRGRSSRARKEAALLHDQLTELTLVRDRDRIAADLQDKVIQQVFAVGLSLHSTAMLVTKPEVRNRILASANDLDEVLRLTRDAVFGLEQHLQGRGTNTHAAKRQLAAAAGRLSLPAAAYCPPAPLRRALGAVREALSRPAWGPGERWARAAG